MEGSVGWNLFGEPWLMWLSGLSTGLPTEVTGSISGQGTCLCCRLGPWLGACKRQPVDVSLLSPSLPLSLKINK